MAESVRVADVADATSEGPTGAAPGLQCALGAAVLAAYLREITLRFDYAVVGLRPVEGGGGGGGGALENDLAGLLDGLLATVATRFAPAIQQVRQPPSA